MILNQRQQLARRLADELGKFDSVWVTSPLPLDDHAKLRFQLLDTERNAMLQIIRDWGYEPVCCGVLPRVHPTGMLAACAWEIDLPRERQPIVDDRKIHGEIAKPEKTSAEIEGMRRYLGLGPKK